MASRTTLYKIAIFGAGDVGCIVIREATRLPEFEVIGALVFSENKDGVNIGTLAGIAPLGITATRDMDKFLATDSDTVVHLGLDAPHVDVQGQLVTLLEAGRNVVTSHPFSYLLAQDPDFGKAIKTAFQKG